jgi:hypothetical protein
LTTVRGVGLSADPSFRRIVLADIDEARHRYGALMSFTVIDDVGPVRPDRWRRRRDVPVDLGEAPSSPSRRSLATRDARLRAGLRRRDVGPPLGDPLVNGPSRVRRGPVSAAHVRGVVFDVRVFLVT